MGYEQKVKKYFKDMDRYVEYDHDVSKFLRDTKFLGADSEKAILTYLRRHKDSILLDCGFGAGGSMYLFSKYASKVYGIDFTKKRVIEFRKRSKKLGLKNLVIQEGDVRKLRYRDEFFDVTYSFSVLFYLQPIEQEQAIKEMYRVTKKGGLCIINVGNSSSIFTAAWNKTFFNNLPQFFVSYSKAKRMITDAGFIIKNVEGFYLLPNLFPKIYDLTSNPVKFSLLKRFAFHLYFICEKK